MIWKGPTLKVIQLKQSINLPHSPVTYYLPPATCYLWFSICHLSPTTSRLSLAGLSCYDCACVTFRVPEKDVWCLPHTNKEHLSSCRCRDKEVEDGYLKRLLIKKAALQHKAQRLSDCIGSFTVISSRCILIHIITWQTACLTFHRAVSSVTDSWPYQIPDLSILRFNLNLNHIS